MAFGLWSAHHKGPTTSDITAMQSTTVGVGSDALFCANCNILHYINTWFLYVATTLLVSWNLLASLVVCEVISATQTLKVWSICVKGPGSKLLVLGMVIQPLIGNPYNGYINPYYWVDDHNGAKGSVFFSGTLRKPDENINKLTG